MKKRFIIAVLTLALVLSVVMPLAVTVSAAGLSVSGGGEAEVGDSITITVKYKGDNLGGAQGYVTYNDSILEYTGGSNTGGGGGKVKYASWTTESGVSSISFKIKFKVKGSGSCTVKATTEKFIDFEENSIGKPSDSTTVKVAGSVTPSPSPSSEPTPTPTKSSPSPTKSASPSKTRSAEPTATASETPAPEAITFTYLGKTKVIQEKISRSHLPDGFEKTDIKIGDREVEAAVGRDMTLIYATDTDGSNGGLYIKDGDSYFPYMSADVHSTYFIQLPEGGTKRPEGYGTATTFEVLGTILSGYASDSNDSIFLVYGRLKNEEGGWYLYDSATGFFVSYFTDRTAEPVVTPSPSPSPTPSQTPTEEPEKTPEPTATPTEKPEPTPEPTPSGLAERILGDRQLFLTAALAAGVILLFLILVIILAVRAGILRKKVRNLEEDLDYMIDSNEAESRYQTYGGEGYSEEKYEETPKSEEPAEPASEEGFQEADSSAEGSGSDPEDGDDNPGEGSGRYSVPRH